ncbi:MAG: maleate cis-trans isomerase [Candidatus Geothermarchaeales archaeon]
MYGSRARMGLIVPPTNTVMESEFHRMAPEGVSVHVARPDWDTPDPRPEAMLRLSGGVVHAARRVALAGVQIIIWGCTSGSFLKGLGYDREMAREIEEATGVEGLTTSTAVIEALGELGLRRIAVATPYVDEVNEREVEFLAGHGFEVTEIKGLGIIDPLGIGRLTPSVAYDLAKEVDSPGAEGVFISCTDLRTIDVIGRLEEELGKPVISSSQASMWAALNRVGVMDVIDGFGCLLARRY